MIRLSDEITPFEKENAQAVKIISNYRYYRDTALFWSQNGGDAVISMLDGDMVIYSNSKPDYDELNEFIRAVSPKSIFSDISVLDNLGIRADIEVCVMTSNSNFESDILSDRLSSRQIYDILKPAMKGDFSYPDFAVDFCHRLNHGGLNYFALEGVCAAIGIMGDKSYLISGISSVKKGYGSIALKGLGALNKGRTAYACCAPEIKRFYLKNGFIEEYKAGYKVGKNELF